MTFLLGCSSSTKTVDEDMGATDTAAGERCWSHSIEDCPVESGECEYRRGSKYDVENECYQEQLAYCQPTNGGCSQAFTTTLDADGGCWLMNSICDVPSGWENEEAARSCPYEGEAPDCLFQ